MASRTSIAVIVAMISLLIAVCGRSDKPSIHNPTPTPIPTSTPSPTPTPVPLNIDTLLRDAGKVMEGLKSFEFKLTHENGSTQLFSGLFIENAQGTVINPDKISVEFIGTFGTSFAVKSGLITIGADSYMLNPLTGEWSAEETGVNPMEFFKPQVGIASMMIQLENVHQIKNEGTSTEVYQLVGNLASKALSPLLGVTLEDAKVNVELTIDTKTSLLLQARVLGRVTPTDVYGVVRVITLSGFNESISIEPPI